MAPLKPGCTDGIKKRLEPRSNLPECILHVAMRSIWNEICLGSATVAVLRMVQKQQTFNIGGSLSAMDGWRMGTYRSLTTFAAGMELPGLPMARDN